MDGQTDVMRWIRYEKHHKLEFKVEREILSPFGITAKHTFSAYAFQTAARYTQVTRQTSYIFIEIQWASGIWEKFFVCFKNYKYIMK